jgi:hypothetical protein
VAVSRPEQVSRPAKPALGKRKKKHREKSQQYPTGQARLKNIMSPAIAAALILTAKLIICKETRENPSLGKNSAKVNHCLYSSTEQLQVAL